MQIFCNNVGTQPSSAPRSVTNMSALLQHKVPRGKPSLPEEGQTDSAAQTAIFLWLPLFFVSFINPCSLSLTLHIALKLICLVLAQRAMKLLWCDPVQYSQPLHAEISDNRH